MNWYDFLIIAYLCVTNVVAVTLTVSDKRRAERKKRRIPENTLMLWAALSGCVAMYITMHTIHHKTRKRKFMVGIPIIFIVECAVFFGVLYLCKQLPFFG
ncbi:MAG: DUF1294 domain-containing protein [Acutalibacteraceae bacterium]